MNEEGIQVNLGIAEEENRKKKELKEEKQDIKIMII